MTQYIDEFERIFKFIKIEELAQKAVKKIVKTEKATKHATLITQYVDAIVKADYPKKWVEDVVRRAKQIEVYARLKKDVTDLDDLSEAHAVFTELLEYLESAERIAGTGTIKAAIQKILQATTEEELKANIIAFRRLLEELLNKIEKTSEHLRSVGENIDLPEELSGLAKDPDIFEEVMEILSSDSPKLHDKYRKATVQLQKYNDLKKAVQDYTAISESMVITDPLKNQMQRGIKTIKLLSDAKKEAFKNNVEFKTDGTEVKQGIDNVTKLLKQVNEAQSGLDGLFKNYKHRLEKWGIEVSELTIGSSVETPTYIGGFLKDIYDDLKDIEEAIIKYNAGELDTIEYTRWYIDLQNKIQELANDYRAFLNVLQKNIDVSKVEYDQAQAMADRFRSAVPWIDDYIFPKKAELDILIPELQKFAPARIRELARKKIKDPFGFNKVTEEDDYLLDLYLTQNHKEYYDAVIEKILAINRIQNTFEDYVVATDEEILEVIKAKIRQARDANDFRLVKEYSEQFNKAAKISYQHSKESKELVTIESFIDNILKDIDFKYEYGEHMLDGLNTVFTLGKLSKEARASFLNNIESLQVFFQDEEAIEALQSVFHPDALKAYRPSEQKILISFARLRDGLANKEIFEKAIDIVVSSVPDKRQRDILRNAIITTVQNLAPQDVVNLDVNQIMSQIVDSIQGYTNAFKLGRKPKSMDYLRTFYELKTENVDKIADELAKAGIVLNEYEKEHSALYDVASQIMVWEKEHPNVDRFHGVMLDIETAGSLDKYGNPTGAITEVALMTRDENGALKVLGHFRVQDTEDNVRLLYTNTSDVAYKMGLDPTEQIQKYISNTDVVTEEDLLNQVYDTLEQLPEFTEVHTYNGSRFDVPYLQARAKTLGVRKTVRTPNPKYLTDAEIQALKESAASLDFQEIFSRLKWKDDLVEKNKDLFTMPPEIYIRLKQTIADHLQRQLALRKYDEILDEAGNPINAQRTRFFTEIGGVFIKEVLDVLQEDTIDRSLIDYVANVQQGLELYATIYENLDEVVGYDMDELEDLISFEDPTILLNRLKELNIPDDPKAFDPMLRKYLANIKDDLIATLNDIKFTHEYLRKYPIIEDIYNVQSERFSAGLAKRIYKAWQAAQIEEGIDLTDFMTGQKKERFFTNLTGAINFEGQTAIAYKNYRPELLRLIDITPIKKYSEKFGENVTLAVREQLDSYLRTLKQEANRIRNYGVVQAYYDDAMQMLEFLKDNAYRIELETIKLDSVSKRESWAQLQVVWQRINIDKEYYTQAAKLDEQMRKLNPELASLLDQKVAYFNIEWKDTELKWVTNEAAVKARCMDYYHVVSQGAEIDRLDKALKEFKYYGTSKPIVDKIHDKVRNLIDLRKKSYTAQGYATKTTSQYARLGRDFNDTLYAYSLYNKLTSTPEELLSAILYDTTSRTMRIVRPTTDRVFNTPELFLDFLRRSDEYKSFGMNFKYDETNRVLEITLDKSLDIRKSENTTSGFRWLVNNKEIEPVAYKPLTKEAFEKGYAHKIHQSYRDALYDLYLGIVTVDTRYAGRTGAIAVFENGKGVIDELEGAKVVDSMQDLAGYTPYFDESWIGTYTDLQGFIGPRYADAFYSLDSMAMRTSKHHINKNNYAEFIMNTGFNLQDEIIKDVPLEQLSAYLNKNPDLVVAYFKADKHAIGGVVIDVLHHIDPETLKIVQESGDAFILPWEIYTAAARNFNQFAYDNRFVEAWYKLIQLYKKAWLMSPGVILRNAVDSTMKNFFEGGTPDNTVKAYADAQKLLVQFDQITKEISQLDPGQVFRFDNAISYFIKNDTLMDKDTYMLLYQLMNDMGINTMYTMVDGVFGAFMKPMAMIERTARLSMFLNLKGQGKQYSEILRRIAETHFTYDVSDSLGFIKALLPFHTYTFSNLNYIMHLIEENPSVLGHFLNTYSAMWNLDNIEQDELENNVSLQYQLLNGNIPLSFFGYKDKEIVREIETKYGKQLQTVKNTAVIKVGSSILDGLNTFINPYQSFMDKIAPPARVIMDTMTEYLATATGNFSKGTWYDYQDAESRYERGIGSVSLQRMVEDPSAILDTLPIVDTVKQRFFHKEGDQYKFGSTTGYRTQNPILGALSMAGITGATSRWGEFAQRPKQNYKRKTTTKSSGYKYYRPARTYNSRYRFNRNDLHLYNVLHPNAQQRAFSKLRSIPQYLYSNMGVNSRGKSKVASWMDMNARYKVQNTLRRMVYM